MSRVGPALVLGLALASSGVAGAELPDDPAYQEARAAFALGEYSAAEQGFATLQQRYPEAPEVLFWQAYTSHRLGLPEAALATVEQCLLLDPGWVDPLYLRGLLRHQAGDRAGALADFDRVVALDPDGALGPSAAEHAETLRTQAAREAILEVIADGDLDRAEALLAASVDADSEPTWVLYHRGYVAYLQARHEDAIAHLDELLWLTPGDPWGRYLRALARQAAGHDGQWRPTLEELAATGEPDVAAQAAARLAELSPAPPGARPTPSASRSTWRFQSGAGLDSNPAYVADSSYVPDSDRAVTGESRLRGEVLLWKHNRVRVHTAPTLLVRAYGSGVEGRDLAQAGLRAEVSAGRGSARAWAGLGAGVSWLGWQLFLDAEEVYAGLRWRPVSGTWTRLSLGAYRRQPWQAEYANLEALGGALRVTQTFRPGDVLQVSGGLRLRAERAEAYEATWSSGGGELLVLEADASFVGLGPVAALSVEAPWRTLEVRGSAGLEWRRYAVPERYGLAQSTDQEVARRDLRLATDLQVSAELIGPLRLYLRHTFVANGSTIDGSSTPVDRRFTRQLATLGAEVTL